MGRLRQSGQLLFARVLLVDRRRAEWLLIAAVAMGCGRSPTVSTSRPTSSANAPVPAAAAASDDAERLAYVELPPRGTPATAALPLVVAIHGLGDRPESFAHLFASFDAPARIIVPRAPEQWGSGFSWFPFRGTSDPTRGADGIARAAERLARTIDAVSRERPTLGKPIVTGFSQGGALSFALAARYPDRIGAAFPVGGWLPEPLWPETKQGARLRIVAYHGEADELVPIAETRRSVEALKARGISVELRSFAGVGHSISEEMRRDLLAEIAQACRRAQSSAQ